MLACSLSKLWRYRFNHGALLEVELASYCRGNCKVMDRPQSQHAFSIIAVSIAQYSMDGAEQESSDWTKGFLRSRHSCTRSYHRPYCPDPSFPKVARSVRRGHRMEGPRSLQNCVLSQCQPERRMIELIITPNSGYHVCSTIPYSYTTRGDQPPLHQNQDVYKHDS